MYSISCYIIQHFNELVCHLFIYLCIFSFQDVRKIKHLCQSSQYYGLEALNKSVGSKQNLEINGSQVTIENTLPSYLASLVTKNLLNHKEVNKECDFEMNLEKLVLYQAGGSFKSHRSDRNESSSWFLLFSQEILTFIVYVLHRDNRQSNPSHPCRWRPQRRAA